MIYNYVTHHMYHHAVAITLNAVVCLQMHASYVKAVSKTKQALEQTRAEEASVAELRSKAVEYSRYERTR